MYFSAGEKNRFEASLSAQAYSYGVYIKKNIMDEAEIDRLVPGGPAWKSAKLNAGDIIIRIVFPDKNRQIEDLNILDQDEINELLNTPDSKSIEITVRKKNGLTQKVKLIKEKLQVEENIIDSFILKGSANIGYIYLPAFYSEWEETNSFGCANDVAKEIVKLKRENITGLILDLRNNSGGSLEEALNLAGIFIDEGPLIIAGNRGGKPVIVKDRNRGTIYDGPLLLLLNEYTVSASEFLAQILRDYNRAIIVGRTTFGKATSQVFIPVVKDPDSFDPHKSSKDKSIDFVNLTINKFYNLSGNTHQLSGVYPDVSLPGYLEYLIDAEKDYPYALKPDRITKEVHYDKGPEIKIKYLAKMSADRIARDKNFQKLKSLDKQLKEYFKETIEFPLSMADFFREMRAEVELLESLEQTITCVSPSYTVVNNQYDLDILQMDSYRKIRNDDLIKQIHEDIYLEEAYRIMNDLIKTIKK
jgi:carboxyl-terminal processing protease